MNHQQQSVVADLQRLLANCGAAQTCEVSVRLVGQWLSKLTAPVGPASAPVAGDQFTHNDDCARYLASAPVAPHSCPTDVCQAAKADGVLCANDECDRSNGVRPPMCRIPGVREDVLRRAAELMASAPVEVKKQKVCVHFGEIGSAGSFPIDHGWVTIPDVTMRDLADRMQARASAPVADERAAFSRAEISFPLTIPENRVYLAGPMTGHENHNFPAFHAAAERLRGLGMEVVNPADHGLVSGLGWSDYMRWDLVKLAGCHAVYVLPGWEKSKGASLEVSIARALGMLVFTVDGAVLASAPVAKEAQPGDYVQPVPDHCDRIVWRGRYYALGRTALLAREDAAPQASEAVNAQATATGGTNA